MSVDLHVVFLRDAEGEHHQKMLGVARACLAAGVDLPEPVADYFQVGVDDAKYAVSNSDEPLTLTPHAGFSEYAKEWESGYEIDVAQIPEGVVKIRAYLS